MSNLIFLREGVPSCDFPTTNKRHWEPQIPILASLHISPTLHPATQDPPDFGLPVSCQSLLSLTPFINTHRQIYRHIALDTPTALSPLLLSLLAEQEITTLELLCRSQPNFNGDAAFTPAELEARQLELISHCQLPKSTYTPQRKRQSFLARSVPHRRLFIYRTSPVKEFDTKLILYSTTIDPES